ncbi:FERM and PDZ domain-containing protein 4 [Caerostris extrusa]|uniref:FERM and PDZ domain-containing protein 4 n=1 Tax=Caerostris extrusa TaxID=172846 RepID=A0AAV4MI33_CAEEX|nr:FERM and PDZ domain-containing protein 4 [Caerostris extrusa]
MDFIHETKISSWLPPVESWDSGGTGLPYGWEAAMDKDGKTYYINHTNRTTTYENPRKDGDEEPPQPREVQLVRDAQMGFGFVAGSEKPVIVRFVTEGGPNEHKLMPGDQIMKINGEDVMRSPREHVIELIRSCKQTVNLLVCQPQTNNTTRKSALLTAAKKAKLRNNPSRVRFSEGVIINGSPLYSPSPVDGNVPFLPNVLKVFLENGQTKSFKYDSTTTVQDVLNSLVEKLSITCVNHFCLATEHVKITRKNRLSILDPKDTLTKIASKPGAHHLPFEYLYLQCCNDVVEERFTPELKYDIALRLTALNMQQHCLSNGIQGKVTVKTVERECGLERFVPVSLLETMKLKELRKLLGHFLKQNQSLCAPGQKHLTPLQAKLHYLKIISELPSYGSKCFSTNISDTNPETTVLVSPRFGVAQISCLRNTSPITLCRIEDISSVKVKREDEYSCLVEILTRDVGKQHGRKDADEFILLLKGYYRLTYGKELPVHVNSCSSWQPEPVPSFHSRHVVREAPWSYAPFQPKPSLRTLDLAVMPPIYTAVEMPRGSPKQKPLRPPSPTPVDHNMNETASESQSRDTQAFANDDARRLKPHRTMIDERHPGIDYQTVISMELLEDSSGDIDVDVYEAKNDEVIQRISEMNHILTEAESYLSDGSHNEHSNLKAADSLVLLSQSENHQDLPLKEIIDVDISPSESDTDSTPNESPLHRSVPIRNSINGPHPMIRRDSSFGLHSPDLLPNINSGNNILDILKHLQAEEVNLPFAEETICLDPDIIDLTMIPPPVTPEMETSLEGASQLDTPPAAFLGALFKNLEDCNGYPERSAELHRGMLNGGSGIYYEENHQISNPEHDSLDSGHASLSANGSSLGNGDLKIENIDSLIATLTIPPPPDGALGTSPVSNEDLSAYIIPPPPSSSPSTEAQNEVIARFMAAAEDIKNLFQREDSEISFKDLGSELKLLGQTCYPLEFDTGSHSGDSSGYDTLTSSLTSYSDTVISDDLDGLWSATSTNWDPSSNDATPFDRSPSDVSPRSKTALNGLPVPPTLKTSCVEDATSPLSITSPSSTTSSDSSVILLDSSSGLDSGRNFSSSETGSCDNLLSENFDPVPQNIVRSVSWTNIVDLEDSKEDEEDKEPNGPNSISSFHSSMRQSRLRRSFNRGQLSRQRSSPESQKPH